MCITIGPLNTMIRPLPYPRVIAAYPGCLPFQDPLIQTKLNKPKQGQNMCCKEETSIKEFYLFVCLKGDKVDTRHRAAVDLYNPGSEANQKITDLAVAQEELKKFSGKYDTVYITRVYGEYDLTPKLVG